MFNIWMGLLLGSAEAEIKTTIITESYRVQSISDLDYNFQILFSQEINDGLLPTENATDFWG